MTDTKPTDDDITCDPEQEHVETDTDAPPIPRRSHRVTTETEKGLAFTLTLRDKQVKANLKKLELKDDTDGADNLNDNAKLNDTDNHSSVSYHSEYNKYSRSSKASRYSQSSRYSRSSNVSSIQSAQIQEQQRLAELTARTEGLRRLQSIVLSKLKIKMEEDNLKLATELAVSQAKYNVLNQFYVDLNVNNGFESHLKEITIS